MSTLALNTIKNAVDKLYTTVLYACQSLEIADVGYLPVGGKYPKAIYTKPVTIRNHRFYAIVYRPEIKWSLGICVVEEFKPCKKCPDQMYRVASLSMMTFGDGKVESFWEGLDWGYCSDGYGMMLEHFASGIHSYLKRFPTECGTIGAETFGTATEALDYYSAWQTAKEQNDLIKRTNKQLREFNKARKKKKEK
ncbi:hypothetical protein [uncultured Duncaniella sp.]|uniref:hypothetical protein n=1 Tax=uncultured Duncaniella sp. TaxID=2768039 RepID=UPI00262393FB|nr:hypothetical protein [uncultured Duncaniella sp.]